MMNNKNRYLSHDEEGLDFYHFVYKSISSRSRVGERHAGALGGLSRTQREPQGLFDDKYLHEILRRYEKSLGSDQVGRSGSGSDSDGLLINVQVNINQPMHLHILSGDGQTRGAEYQPVCRLVI